MMIYFKMCFKVPYFLSDHAAFAKRYCKNKQNINSLTCFLILFYILQNKQNTNVKHELNIENDGRL